ncbi:MAG: class I SAM-dependent methyltransferase [Clostridiales bacterium]
MSTEIFTGRAEAYAKARLSYPEAALDYIGSLIPPDAVFADIGAGTGKLTLLLGQRRYPGFAVEPNADMRKQLTSALSPYLHVKIIGGSAEATTLPDHSVDVVLCAQALHWFNPEGFRAECRRICKPGGIVIAVYNVTEENNSSFHSKSPSHSKTSAHRFFDSPALQEFANPQFYTRENWLAYMTSHSHDPLPADAAYAAHIAEMNEIFDRESIDGLLRRNVVTEVYSEKIDNLP